MDLTVAGDPTPRTGRVHGTTPGQAVLTFDAVVDRVRFPMDPGRSAVAVHTPVTVLVRAQDIAAWRGLVPSTRVAAGVRATAPGERDHDSAARLVALGPPRLLAPPGRSQQLAAELRSGLREATDHLSPDIRGLLPGLVVGDTSRLPDDLREAFRATDLGHLTAVSGEIWRSSSPSCSERPARRTWAAAAVWPVCSACPSGRQRSWARA
ncbi:hypothetical protein ACFQ1I_16085 [Kitasatospora arboriphila]